MCATVADLVSYYEKVFAERMRDLPVVNAALSVEAVGFRELAEHRIGALVTPWFINLVLLPGSDRWDGRPQGSACKVELPGGKPEFTISHEGDLGTTLSAALFSTVADFPSQALARDIAAESLRLLFSDAAVAETGNEKSLTRRELLRSLGGINDPARIRS